MAPLTFNRIAFAFTIILAAVIGIVVGLSIGVAMWLRILISATSFFLIHALIFNAIKRDKYDDEWYFGE